MHTIVIKIGGNAATQLTPTFFETIKQWQQQGKYVVIVHGGGTMISNLMAQFNEPVIKKDGIRVTNSTSIELTKMALIGQVQPQILDQLRQNNLNAIGLNAGSAQLLTGSFLNQSCYGLVGKIDQVNVKIIKTELHNGYIPVISPLAITNDGQWLNVNADQAATAIAKHLRADHLYLLTDVSGIKVAGNILHHITPTLAQELEMQSIITGGMIPKVNNALTAVAQGVTTVHITDHVNTHGTLVTA
ncbi:acetylglutamate kinase [Leuconostoc fallax]|uniref:acetylglutamate kinase n=1 Tax=Leuconostoc fallax TaxID=1251 RepID=UPI00209124AD|nr:acetylglutamate kinase [Leuconostoc fallax]MCO6184148.1 acetylglutamate kinase [Leuconostoc fallax]